MFRKRYKGGGNVGIKKILTSWQIWLVAVLVGGFLLFQRSFDTSTLFILGLVLLCPIMMIFMMKDHKH